MPLKEAAAVLGVSKDAVRQRIRRDTLRSDKGEDGRVYVYLDTSIDNVHGPPASEAGDDPLYREMQARIAYLEGQVAEEREARRRADTLLARLMDRMPALEAPQETSESSETIEEEPERAEPRSATPGPQEGTERPQERSWWRVSVDKLPWWNYVLLVVWWVAWMTAYSCVLLFDRLNLLEFSHYVDFGANALLLLFGPLSAGYWIGTRKRSASILRDFLPIGLVAALLSLAVMLVFIYLFAGPFFISGPFFIPAPDRFLMLVQDALPVFSFLQLSPVVIYLLAATWANGRQRRRAIIASEGSDVQLRAADRQAMIAAVTTIISTVMICSTTIYVNAS